MAYCCQYDDLKPGGGFRAFHRVLVYLCGESGTEPSVTPRSGWSPLTDRWCIGRLIRKRPLHSSAYRLILQWGRALRFDTAQAEAVHRSSGHAISQLLSRNKSVVSAHAQVSWSGRKRRSPNLYGRCTHVCLGYCTGHTPFSIGHAISQLLSRTRFSQAFKFCFVLLFFSNN